MDSNINNTTEIILEIKDITKSFGAVNALDNVSFYLKRNEVLGIVGDNGAGKSTLIKIISGVYQPDHGQIFFEGKKTNINNPMDAKNLGIETVYQDLALVEELDVPSNIFLGREPTYLGKFGNKVGLMNFTKMYSDSKTLINKLKSNIPNIKSPVRYLSGGQRQAVAISKVVFWGKQIVILDEPTAALGVREAENVLQLIKSLKEHGLSVIIISHNLQHVFRIVDRIMVLRLGKNAGIVNAHETDADNIVGMITGAKFVEKV